MEIVMMIVAWGMVTGMLVGALGGWLVLAIGWLSDMHANGRFELLTRHRRPRRWSLFRGKQATGT